MSERSCYGCANSTAWGYERGYSPPCGSCRRPELSNFVSIERVLKKRPALTTDCLTMMANLHARRWWCEGIVERGWYETKDGSEAMGRARATEEFLLASGAACRDSGSLRLLQAGVFWLTGARPPEPWGPIRSGDTYCSPACGHGCTWAAHEAAQASARKLVDALGDGFEPRVWENMGWHWGADARSGVGDVSPSIGANRTVVGYSARINGGSRWRGEGRTPRAAWEKAVEVCRATRDANARTLAAVGAL